MVSLARQSLLYDWRRFVAAILTLAFSGLLILVQVGLLLGQLDAFTLPIRRARADLWVTAPNISSWEQSTIVAARTEGSFWSHPAVRDVQEMGLGQGDWRTGDGKRQAVMVIGVSVQPGSLSDMTGFEAETLALLARPDTVVIDRTDAAKLGARTGETAEISGKRVIVGGFVRSFRSNMMPLVFASQATLRQLNQDWSGNGPPYLLLRLDPRFDAETVRNELKATTGPRTYDVATPEELIFQSGRFWLEESGSGTSFAFSMLLALMVGVGVTSQTLRGAVTASLKEYAALRALGVRVARLRGIVLEQSLWVALAGIVLMAVTAALSQRTRRPVALIMTDRLPPAIRAEGIVKSYGSGATRMDILRGIDLVIHRGELTLLMGPSGSGKSTLMAVLAGLSQPDLGTVSILGQALHGLDEDALNDIRLRHCGFIFQGFNLFGALSALDQVRLVLDLTGTPAADIDPRARATLGQVGLADRLRLKPAALSGGEKQRVAIARALAKQPALLFADEPTSALDRQNGEIVTRLLARIARDHGAAVLCVTHDSRLLPFADRILRIEDGRIVGDERPAAHTLQSHQHENAET